MSILRRRRTWLATAAAILVCFLGGLTPASVASPERRLPKVAGEFYPDGKAELLDLVTEFVKRQPETPQTGAATPRLLIVPHAGYQYSGLVAGNGFRQLQGHHYDDVVVVAFTHRMEFDGSSVDTAEAYETPLGTIPVDREAVAILQTFPGITHNEAAHASGEHSLEVELPFLQVALDRFRLVPILIGNTRLKDAEQLADALARLDRLGNDLFVFSTDLSHYHSHDQAEVIDDRTIHAILEETPQAVHQLFEQGQIEACGQGPIVTSLFLSQRLGYLKRTLLYRANSGDTWGNASRVVGYASIGMFNRPAVARGRLSSAGGAALVRAARQTLEQSLRSGHAVPATSLLQGRKELSQASGLFVTLRKQDALRGCIGRIQTNDPLAKSLPAVALDAALRDPRFPPVTADELSQLHIEVSVLTPPAPVNNPSEIIPGRDGVILEADAHAGVFLPQVWDETGWTKIEFLRELASQKAGLSPDAWQRARLSTFQAQVFDEER